MKYSLLSLFLFWIQPCFGQPNQSDLIGKWINQDYGYAMVLEFTDAQNGSFEGENFTYQLKSSASLVLVIHGQSTTYSYQLQGDRLTLSGGDLDAAISFSKSASPAKKSAPVTTPNSTPLTSPATSTAPANNALIGRWLGQGEVLEFNKDGKCIFKDVELNYTLTATQIIIDVQAQKLTMPYTLADNELQLNLNNQTYYYRKEGSPPRKSSSKNPPELAGKWCYMSTYMLNSNSGGGTGGSSSEECITLHANGQFEYYAENSMSTNTNSYWGGTSSQNSDSGSWWFDGEKIHYQSQRTGKSGSYQLEKRNHPKNRDPMIVLDGRAYVTQYQKAPW